MTIEVDIRFDCDAWRDAVPDVETICRETVRAAIAAGAQDASPAEVGVVLADDRAVARLNETYRGKQGPTNVLSFAADDPDFSFDPTDTGQAPRLYGDVVIAFETTAGEAQSGGKPLDHHVRHLIAHGVLHLLGYDHEDEIQAEAMEALEGEILASFGVDDPYRDEKPFVA